MSNSLQVRIILSIHIDPGAYIDSHSYIYLVDPGEQAGTFWYHSHLSTQYIDGLRGPLIIYGKSLSILCIFKLIASDPNDPHAHLYDVDDASTVISLTDWYQQYSEQLVGMLYFENSMILDLKKRTQGTGWRTSSPNLFLILFYSMVNCNI